MSISDTIGPASDNTLNNRFVFSLQNHVSLLHGKKEYKIMFSQLCNFSSHENEQTIQGDLGRGGGGEIH